MTMFDLTGRVGLVTGGNGGIGLGLGRGLAKAGARVMVAGRNAAKNAAAVAELQGLGAEVPAGRFDGAGRCISIGIQQGEVGHRRCLRGAWRALVSRLSNGGVKDRQRMAIVFEAAEDRPLWRRDEVGNAPKRGE